MSFVFVLFHFFRNTDTRHAIVTVLEISNALTSFLCEGQIYAKDEKSWLQQRQTGNEKGFLRSAPNMHNTPLDDLFCVERGRYISFRRRGEEYLILQQNTALYRLRDVVYNSRFEPFPCDLSPFVEGIISGLLYAENAACDVSPLEVEGNVSDALITEETGSQKECKRVVGV